MASHVSDTWNACPYKTHGKLKIHVLIRHMASHASTCMGFDLCINRGGGGGGGGGGCS